MKKANTQTKGRAEAPVKKAAQAPAKKAAPTAAQAATPAKKVASKSTVESEKAVATAPKKTGGNKSGIASKNKSMLLEFFSEELKDIYWAEKHLVKTLPKMQKAATSAELKNAIGEHTEVTKKHVDRLEEVFRLLGKKVTAKKCDAMAGITEEGESIIEDTEKGTATRDVGIILASQKVEHYEIATYGGLAQLARTLGLGDIAQILATTLEEEKQADTMLTEIAERYINEQASEENEE